MESFGKDRTTTSSTVSHTFNCGKISPSPNGYSTPITSPPVKSFQPHTLPWDTLETRSECAYRQESTIATPKRGSMIYSTANKDTKSVQKEILASMNFQEELYSKLKNVAAENETILDEMKEITRVKQEIQLLAQEIMNPDLKDTVFKLHSVTKQKDFFEAEYRRVLRELHRREILISSRIENTSTITELQKELAELKFQSQGEINRLNQVISTQELEISGLKNLRDVLEVEVARLKNIEENYDSANAKLSRLEVENIDLKNKVEASNLLLKSAITEHEGIEAGYQSKLRELAQEIQVSRQQLAEASNTGDIRFVLIAAENDRLHNVINNLYEKINHLEEQQINTADSQKAEVERLQGTLEQLESKLKDFEAQSADDNLKLKTLVAEFDKLRTENTELVREVNHWKDRYKMIENSHKYLVGAVDKMRAHNVVDLSVTVLEDGTTACEGLAINGENLFKEANFYKAKAFNLEKRTILLMIEIERLQSVLSKLTQQANGFNNQ